MIVVANWRLDTAKSLEPCFREKQLGRHIQGASLRARPTPPATLAQEGKTNQVSNYAKRTEVRDKI